MPVEIRCCTEDDLDALHELYRQLHAGEKPNLTAQKFSHGFAAMLEYARSVAQAQGCYKLSLTSHAKRTDAHAFYRKCGMVQHGVSFRYELSN